MWFLESEHDVEPFDVAQTALASDAMWLVEGPTDPRPMPLSEQATSKRPRPTTGGGAAAPAAPGPSKTQRRGSITAKEADAAAAAVLAAAAEESTTTSADGSANSTSTFPALRPISRAGGKPVQLALVGATGLVGRACATYLARRPELGFKVSHFIGSAESVGQTMGDVADKKESKLQKHYGAGFWDSDADVDAHLLRSCVVSDVDALLREGPSACDVVLSFLAPRFGHLEDALIAAGFRLVSISPHARMAHPLLVPIVNANLVFPPPPSSSSSSLSPPNPTTAKAPPSVSLAQTRCLKSPNCCSVGSSVALLPLVDHFTVQEVFVTTFQTLSGRGDACYPAEKVVANVYPIGATEERTEEYIAQEVSRVFAQHPRATHLRSPEAFHVSAYRVYVQKNHLLDVRVRVAETVRPGVQGNTLLAALYGQVQYRDDVNVETEAGLPRPKSHADGNKVTVGNFSVETCPSGGSFLRVSATVDNVAKGAWGNALDITTRLVQACEEAEKERHGRGAAAAANSKE